MVPQLLCKVALIRIARVVGCFVDRSSVVITARCYKRAMIGLLGSLYISAIIIAAAFLLAAVESLEPNPRLAIIFKCTILAATGAVIAKRLSP